MRGNEKSLKKAIELSELIMEANVPKNFDGKDPSNVILTQRKAFEQLCIILEAHNCIAPKNLTVFEFYSRMKSLEKKKA